MIARELLTVESLRSFIVYIGDIVTIKDGRAGIVLVKINDAPFSHTPELHQPSIIFSHAVTPAQAVKQPVKPVGMVQVGHWGNVQNGLKLEPARGAQLEAGKILSYQCQRY